MENPGLVTYDANIVLSPPGEDSVRHQRQCANIGRLGKHKRKLRKTM